jgi:DNA-binding response OmpR family regulator
MKILLLEDDLILNEIILEHLEEKNYEVTSSFDGTQAQELIYSKNFDLLLLDVNVPNIDGFELLEDLRAQGIKTATIFITSLNMIDDVEKGFKLGCDDYIKKPFELRELDLRIDNIKRLLNISNNDNIKIDTNIQLDSANLEIIKEKNKYSITKKEYEVLTYLIKQENKPVSIEELSLNIWSYEESPSDSTIRTYIKNIRKIIGEEKISNIRGVGYRFNS